MAALRRAARMVDDPRRRRKRRRPHSSRDPDCPLWQQARESDDRRRAAREQARDESLVILGTAIAVAQMPEDPCQGR
jgi:hypothetical protein